MLYREALALGLDKDDTIIKRRMAQKMQFLAEDVAAAREPTYRANSGLVPAAFRPVRHARALQLPPPVFLPRSPREGCTRRRRPRPRKTRGPARELEAGGSAGRSLHVPGLLPRPVDRIPGQGIRSRSSPWRSSKLAPGSWQGPVESGLGWHLVFVDDVIPGRVPEFEEVDPGGEDRLAGRAESAGLGQGLQGNARQVHRAAARAARRRRRLRRGAARRPAPPKPLHAPADVAPT